jgi:hypothetical protein
MCEDLWYNFFIIWIYLYKNAVAFAAVGFGIDENVIILYDEMVRDALYTNFISYVNTLI